MLQENNKSILFFDKNTFKVAELFFDSPNEKFHLRKIASHTKLSTTAVSAACKRLLNFKIISVSRGAVTKEFKADLESSAFYDYKMILNLYRIKRYGLVEEIIEFFNPKTIVLFGSYTKGEDIEKSDIDLLVITKQDEEIDLTDYEKEFNRKIRLYVLKDLSKSDPEFKNSIANGIVLHGYLKVV